MLTPSVTAINRIFEKEVYKFYKGGYPPTPLRMESSAPFEPLVKIKKAKTSIYTYKKKRERK